ncbi:hypothetical protein B566_EDAN009591 [Ephemera danica]|nr:hypothetical protein B566_EDAN009591 [Ephemera danica]
MRFIWMLLLLILCVAGSLRAQNLPALARNVGVVAVAGDSELDVDQELPLPFRRASQTARNKRVLARDRDLDLAGDGWQFHKSYGTGGLVRSSSRH